MNPSSLTQTPEQLAAILATNLKLRRATMKITMHELAVRSQVDSASLSRYEAGYQVPGGWSLFKLARILGCRIDDLFCPTQPEE